MLRDMPSSDLVSLISFLVVLLIFFSIDIKARERRGNGSTKARVYHWVGHLGGIATGIALVIGWLDLWLDDESQAIHVLYIAAPATIGVICAVAVGLEMIFEPPDGTDAETELDGRSLTKVSGE